MSPHDPDAFVALRTLVFGDSDAEPLLGVTALESGGFEVDPRSQQLKRLPAVLLKGLRNVVDSA